MSEKNYSMITEEYKDSYSVENFWDKIKKHAKAAGKEVLEVALKMYYALQDADTPAWAKTVIIGALGYFISPIDLVPDATPVVGYVDDLGVLTAAAATVALHIKDKHTMRAQEKLKKWFG